MIVNTKYFYWHPESRSLSAELSTLEANHYGFGVPQVTLQIESEKTGRMLDFKMKRNIWQYEGEPDQELAGWEFYNSEIDVKAIIWND